MGVLDRLWTGQHTRGPEGAQVPVDRLAVLSDVDDPADWWEIPSKGPLARKIRQYYPDIQPLTDQDGALSDVIPLHPEGDEEAEERARAARQEAARRGYRKAGKVRPLGLMPFLSCTSSCNTAPNTHKSRKGK